jgi:hypothetical protein
VNTKPFLITATALLLGASSAAMAAPYMQARATFRADARPDARFHASVVVRDHRTPTRLVATGTWHRPEVVTRPGAIVLPAVTGPTWDCANWDPTVEASSVCTAYDASQPAAMPAYGAGVLLGVRDAAIPDHQYITVGDGQSFRSIVIQGNDCAPQISKVAIKFMDGSTQVVPAGTQLRQGERISIGLDGGYRQINQIVLYTPYGAAGSYAVYAR